MKATALGLILTVGIISAQAPLHRSTPATPPQPNTDSTPPKKPGSVEGVVTNSVSHEPVKKANVTLRNIGQRFSYAGTTDTAGHFLIENVEPGSYLATADCDGFIPPPQNRRTAFHPITVDEEQHVKDVAVQLLPLGVVSGHVLDEDGEPIAGATVRALQYSYNQGRKQLNPSGTANTNDLGEFQLINVQPARYYLEVTARVRSFLPPNTRGAPPETAFPPTYYPNATGLAQATAQQVTPGGQLIGIDFRLHKVPAHHIRGKVLDSQTGQAARNLGLRIQARDGTQFSPNLFFTQVQQNGTFDIGSVPSGLYTAIVQRQEGQTQTSAREIVNVGDQDVDGVILSLKPGLEITGTMTTDGPPPSTPQNQQQPSAPMKPRVFLQPVDLNGGMFLGTADADGTFVLHAVAPDVYTVMAMSDQPGTYLKSIRLGDQDVPTGQIDLTQMSSAALKIVFGTDGGSIQGTVQDRNGKPAPGLIVSLSPPEEYAGRRDLFKVTSTDPKGNFRFQGLAPGEYKVFAWEDADTNMVQVPEFRKPFESKAASITISANSKESVQLNAITAEEIETEKSKLP
jgi:Carboxypeptidase regulatory-like domain